ncbi:MAG: hypothetical protein ACKOTD_02040 [Phycisphaerales bacterium]
MIRAIAVAIAVLAQSGDAVRAPAAAPPAPWVEARLAALRPERPVAYLELAEDLMDRAGGSASPEADRALARHLAALAGAIDIRGTGRSAALFLLEHAPLGADQSRLRAIASLLDPSTDRAVEAEERSDAAMGGARGGNRLQLEEMGAMVRRTIQRRAAGRTAQFEAFAEQLDLSPEQAEKVRSLFMEIAVQEIQGKRDSGAYSRREREELFGELARILDERQRLKLGELMTGMPGPGR